MALTARIFIYVDRKSMLNIIETLSLNEGNIIIRHRPPLKAYRSA